MVPSGGLLPPISLLGSVSAPTSLTTPKMKVNYLTVPRLTGGIYRSIRFVTWLLDFGIHWYKEVVRGFHTDSIAEGRMGGGRFLERASHPTT